MIVLVMWVSLAVGTEIRVVADSALVARTLDIVVLILAQWSIAVDADMASLAIARSGDRLIERSETVTWMDEARVLDTFRAVVPVWAVEALVTDTEDWLFCISISWS